MIPLLFLMLASFALVQLLALVLGAIFVGQQLSLVENPADPGNSIGFFVYIVATALVLLLVLKFYKGKKLFFILELLLYFTAIQIALEALLSGIAYGGAIAMIAGILAAAVRVFYPQARNGLLLASAAVVGAVLGSSLDLFPAALLAVLLAGYDFIAVFVTKHMVTLAEELEGREAAFSVMFGEPAAKKLPQKRSAAGAGKKVSVIELGTGDLVIPCMLAVSAMKPMINGVPNFFAAASVSLGALAGICVLFYILEKRRGYLPALPPIVFFSLLFLALQTLLAQFL
ncbi:MAG: presenilin family intramembrane aspartyl protease [Candidatus Micrarchaeia archaeon]|jgi:presenilin-like A22 family membrane protease